MNQNQQIITAPAGLRAVIEIEDGDDSVLELRPVVAYRLDDSGAYTALVDVGGRLYSTEELDLICVVHDAVALSTLDREGMKAWAARQKGTQVQSWHAVQTTGTRDSAATHMDSVSIQTTSGETIHAVIRQMWHDPASSELYIWMLTH